MLFLCYNSLECYPDIFSLKCTKETYLALKDLVAYEKNEIALTKIIFYPPWLTFVIWPP